MVERKPPDLARRLGGILRGAQDRSLGLRALRAGLVTDQELSGSAGVEEVLRNKGVAQAADDNRLIDGLVDALLLEAESNAHAGRVARDEHAIGPGSFARRRIAALSALVDVEVRDWIEPWEHVGIELQTRARMALPDEVAAVTTQPTPRDRFGEQEG